MQMSFYFLCTILWLSACAPFPLTEDIAPSPTGTETVLPTPTTDWFPATATSTLAPTSLPSPTPDMHPDLGELLLEDDFSSSAPWPSTTANRTRVNVENNRINLFTDIPSALLLAPRNSLVVNDFYALITANPSLCEVNDEFGMMLRIRSNADHYRFALSCDGRAKVDRVYNGSVSTQAEWQAFPMIPSVAPSMLELSVWASGSEMRFFVDDTLIFTVNDTVLYSGRLGVFIRARGEGPLTVSFSNLMIYALEN
jgi:hypothetical protein